MASLLCWCALGVVVGWILGGQIVRLLVHRRSRCSLCDNWAGPNLLCPACKAAHEKWIADGVTREAARPADLRLPQEPAASSGRTALACLTANETAEIVGCIAAMASHTPEAWGREVIVTIGFLRDAQPRETKLRVQVPRQLGVG